MAKCEWRAYTSLENVFIRICQLNLPIDKLQRTAALDTAIKILDAVDPSYFSNDVLDTGLVYANSHNNIFILDWLLKKNKLISTENVLFGAVDTNNTDPLDWYLAHGLLDPCSSDELVSYTFLASTDKKKVLDWFLANGYNFDTDKYYDGVVGGLIYESWCQGLEWLKANGYIESLRSAFINGSNEHLKKLGLRSLDRLTNWLNSNCSRVYILEV
jgi:hypothetical protein